MGLKVEIKFLIMASSASFLFGQIVIKSRLVFYQTPLSFAFTNIRPVVPGRILLFLRICAVVLKPDHAYLAVIIHSCYCDDNCKNLMYRPNL